MEKDPVCGMLVDEKRAVATSSYKGKSYCFCSTSCREKFEKNPGRFITQP